MNADPRPALRPAHVGVSRRARTALLTVAVLGVLGACGGGDDEATDPAARTSPSASSTPSAPASPSSPSSPSASSTPSTPEDEGSSTASPEVPAGTPACGDIWSEGATIPRSYDGCVQDGAVVERDVLPCSSGQRLVTFGDRFYGVAGGEVRVSQQPLDDDPDYGAAVRSCRA